MISFKEYLAEIESLSGSQFKGDAKDIVQNLEYRWADVIKAHKNAKPLPGGSELTYNVNRDRSGIDILIFDDAASPLRLPAHSRTNVTSEVAVPVVGHMEISSHDIHGAYEVGTVGIVKSHRGKKIGLALYGIVLDTLKLTLVAGSSQTPAGKRMWSLLKGIPGVKVYGLISKYDVAVSDADEGYKFKEKFLKLPDVGVFAQDKGYYAFPVVVSSNGVELKSAIDKLKVYSNNHRAPSVRLVAKKVS